jgi:hypothetical protein
LRLRSRRGQRCLPVNLVPGQKSKSRCIGIKLNNEISGKLLLVLEEFIVAIVTSH